MLFRIACVHVLLSFFFLLYGHPHKTMTKYSSTRVAKSGSLTPLSLGIMAIPSGNVCVSQCACVSMHYLKPGANRITLSLSRCRVWVKQLGRTEQHKLSGPRGLLCARLRWGWDATPNHAKNVLMCRYNFIT